MHRFRSRIAVLATTVFMAGAQLSWTPSAATAASGPICQSTYVPVTVPGMTNASLYGQLCVPSNRTPVAVQLLVHGLLDNHFYFDLPYQPQTYSYVLHATQDGYATFNIDRLGVGASSHPESDTVTTSNSVSTLHQVVVDLRDGTLGSFNRVIWVGHSYGVVYAWLYAAAYQDIDAFVLTGTLHSIKFSYLGTVIQDVYPAQDDPKFADQSWAIGDDGYQTTRPDTRATLFFYTPNADPNVLALDEALVKDTFSSRETDDAANLLNRPSPDAAPSRFITVPTLVLIGDQDREVCGPPDGITCSKTVVENQEQPYYPHAQLTVGIVRHAAHDLQLHLNAADTDDRILNWMDASGVGGR